MILYSILSNHSNLQRALNNFVTRLLSRTLNPDSGPQAGLNICRFRRWNDESWDDESWDDEVRLLYHSHENRIIFSTAVMQKDSHIWVENKRDWKALEHQVHVWGSGLKIKLPPMVQWSKRVLQPLSIISIGLFKTLSTERDEGIFRIFQNFLTSVSVFFFKLGLYLLALYVPQDFWQQ